MRRLVGLSCLVAAPTLAIACRNLDDDPAGCTANPDLCNDATSGDTSSDTNDAGSDVVLDGRDSAPGDADSTVTDSDSGDGAGADADGGCTGECKPGATEAVSGSCAAFFEKKQHTCSAACKWGADECKVPSGWHPIAASPLSARSFHSTNWTGSEMIVWGGMTSAGAPLSDGARFDPQTNTWKAMAAPPSGFLPRFAHAAAWTGSGLVIWGGEGATAKLADGAIYDPIKDTWSPMKTGPLSARPAHAVYATTTGEVLLWGNDYDIEKLPTDSTAGAAYTSKVDFWASMPAFPLANRSVSSFVWTGTQAFVWGGPGATSILSDGARYNPVTTTWTKLDDAPLGFTARYRFASGTVAGGLWLAGGLGSDGATHADGLYFDSAGKVELVSTIPTSVLSTGARAFAAGWCDTREFCWIWSGAEASGTGFKIVTGGALYSIVTKTWLAMPTSSEPAARAFAGIAWTGSSAIVWGGQDFTNALADGALFAP